jgi:hypothetical protein
VRLLSAGRIRVGQFANALSARRQPPDAGPARAVLPAPLVELFLRMPPEDRRHGLAVLRLLTGRGETAPALAQAALLHDVGKAEAGVGLPHRIARVLLRRRARPLWGWLSGRPTGWRRPFWVIANHPERGAIWVETQGGSPDLVALIRYHEQRAPAGWAGTDLAAWHEALAWADAQD